MASIFEILQTATLRYERTLGRTAADSGFGPPSLSQRGVPFTGAHGWTRTGALPGTASTEFDQNCNTWTSNSSGHYGLIMTLVIDPTLVGWLPGRLACDGGGFPVGVWCVQD
jgi:hypothetical protein